MMSTKKYEYQTDNGRTTGTQRLGLTRSGCGVQNRPMRAFC